jgi:hypothetical protein
MFKNFNNYKRESSSRHNSEKLLDRNLVHAHKKLLVDRAKDILKLQEAHKKKSIEDAKNNPAPPAPTSKCIFWPLKQNKDSAMAADDALKKILPRISTHNSKCLKLIKTLFESNITSVSPDLILVTL